MDLMWQPNRSNNVRFNVNVTATAFRVATLHQAARVVRFVTGKKEVAALLTERRRQKKKEI